MNASPRSVEVGGSTPYRIHIGPGLLDDGALLTATLRGRHALIVSDAHVAPLYADQVEASLHAARPELRIARHVIPAGEAHKTLANFGAVIDALAALGATRDACVFALGGGVVGDLAGFAAACWMRGIDCVQLPTTLLAMVDSSVGGKTAVDIPQGKNLVGAFHPPRAVIADTASLRTLPPRELRAGLAEVIKYGPIADADFLDWIEAHLDRLLARDAEALAHAVRRSCEIKAEVVGADEREGGRRAILNFGHTFGHAIEAGLGYGAWLHGEAVGCGMVLAVRLSAALGLVDAAFAARLERIVARAGLPVRPPALPVTRWLELMRLDKKAEAGEIRFVLVERPGVAVMRTAPDALVGDVIAAAGTAAVGSGAAAASVRTP